MRLRCGVWESDRSCRRERESAARESELSRSESREQRAAEQRSAAPYWAVRTGSWRSSAATTSTTTPAAFSAATAASLSALAHFSPSFMAHKRCVRPSASCLRRCVCPSALFRISVCFARSLCLFVSPTVCLPNSMFALLSSPSVSLIYSFFPSAQLRRSVCSTLRNELPHWPGPPPPSKPPQRAQFALLHRCGHCTCFVSALTHDLWYAAAICVYA